MQERQGTRAKQGVADFAVRVGWGRCLRVDAPSVAEQYAELSVQPCAFALCDVCGRMLAVATILLIWVGGWHHAGAHLARIAPAIFFSLIALFEIVMVYLFGPVQWSNSWGGWAAMTAQGLSFTYVAVMPLTLDAQDKPFGTAAAQVVGLGLVVAATVPALYSYTLPAARRKHPHVPRLRVMYHVAFRGVLRVMRILDWWTDAKISLLFLSVSRKAQCTWFTGVSQCARYAAMAKANMACAMGDFVLSICFMTLGYNLENTSTRQRRCDFCAVDHCPLLLHQHCMHAL